MSGSTVLLKRSLDGVEEVADTRATIHTTTAHRGTTGVAVVEEAEEVVVIAVVAVVAVVEDIRATGLRTTQTTTARMEIWKGGKHEQHIFVTCKISRPWGATEKKNLL